MLVFFVGAAVGFSNGAHWCNPTGPTIPASFIAAAHASAIPLFECNAAECVLSATIPFKGYIISSSEPVLNGANACLTHNSGDIKQSVSFTVSNSTTLWATVVFGKQLSTHVYQIAGPHPVHIKAPEDVTQTVYIVGAGPGGIGAARRARSLNYNVVHFERGDYPQQNFYSLPMGSTYLDLYQIDHPGVAFNPMNSVETNDYGLASLVGGLQNLNGGIYAPGTAEELAASTGVTHNAAMFAQFLVARWTPHRPLQIENDLKNKYAHHGSMHACAANCAENSIALYSFTTNRRSIAYNYTGDIVTNTTVTYVTDSVLQLANGTAIPLRAKDVVILSAGALSSPQLLNRTAFCGYNHYYTTTAGPQSRVTTHQVLDYGTAGYEKNYALVTYFLVPTFELEITMDMYPTKQECHEVGQNHTNPAGQTGTQAWHFMGTINHTLMRVHGFDRVYTGDAAALLQPFNCHTSAPASAAGVLAVDAALGYLQTDSPAANLKPDNKSFKIYSKLFALTGIFAAFGVILHVLSGGPPPENASWAFVFIGEVGSWQGACHRAVGYVTIILLIALNGTALTMRDINAWDGYDKPLVFTSVALLCLALVLPAAWRFYQKLYAEPKKAGTTDKTIFQKTLGYAHYIFMTVAVGLVIRAVYLASRHEQLEDNPNQKSYAIQSGSHGHYYVGYLTIALMCLQACAGLYLVITYKNKKPAKDRSIEARFL